MGWAPSCNNQFADRTTIFWLNQRHILAKQEKGLQSQCDLALSYGLIRYNNIKTHHLAIKTTESFIKLRVFPECLLKPHQISVCPRRAPSQLRDAHSVCSAEVIAKSVAFYFVACPSIPCAAEPLFGLQSPRHKSKSGYRKFLHRKWKREGTAWETKQPQAIFGVIPSTFYNEQQQKMLDALTTSGESYGVLFILLVPSKKPVKKTSYFIQISKCKK